MATINSSKQSGHDHLLCVPETYRHTISAASTTVDSTDSVTGPAATKSTTSTSSRDQSGQGSPSSPADADQAASALSRYPADYIYLGIALGLQFATWI